MPSNTWFHNPGAVAFTVKDTSGSIIKSSLDVGIQGSFTEGSGAYSLGNYRVNASYGGISFPLDTNAGADSDTDIPQSGPIKFSDFYNGRLNMLVNYFGQDETRPEKGSTRYNDPAAVVVVGGFKERPNSTTGKKVHLVVGKTMGSKKWESSGEETKCAIRTGTWNSDTKLVVDVGPTAKVFGAGGDGGETTVAAQAGGTGGDEPNTSGGAAGAAGAAIRKSGGITLSITNNGTVYGSTSASGVT